MKNRQRVIERGKNCAIALLIACTIFLAGQTGLLPEFAVAGFAGDFMSGFFGAGKANTAGDPPAAGFVYQPAAYPLFSAVTSENNGRRGAKYDKEVLNEIYSRFSGSLAEALGSAGEPVPVSEDEWKSALTGTGVFFDYLFDQRLSVIAGWLGTQMTGSAGAHFARRICLSGSENGVSLYYAPAGDGPVYRCPTALALSSLRTRTEEFASVVPGNTGFAFELGELFSRSDPYTLIPDSLPEIYELSSANPLASSVSHEYLLGLFDLNSFIASPYIEYDGVVVYVENGAVLRIYPDGRTLFSQNAAPAGPEILSVSDVVELARAFIFSGIGMYCGAAEPVLSDLVCDHGSGTYTLTFDYTVNGIPVSIAGSDCAAEIMITNGVLTYASVIFREYRPGERADVLPEKQAAAAARVSGGGETLLEYEDYGEYVAVNWVIN